jgi:hypothetical protein
MADAETPMTYRRSRRIARPAAAVTAAAIAALLLVHRGDSALLPAAPSETAVTVWVVDNGFHTDLVLPADRLRARTGASAQALKALPATPLVAVGWGDARFFPSNAPVLARPLDGLRALFAPANASVIRLEPLTRTPEQAYQATVLSLRLPQAGFERLARRLDHSFTPAVALARPLPKRSSAPRYFESRERFGVLHLCNDWTAELISAAGPPTRPALDVLSPGLDFDLVAEAGAKRLR